MYNLRQFSFAEKGRGNNSTPNAAKCKFCRVMGGGDSSTDGPSHRIEQNKDFVQSGGEENGRDPHFGPILPHLDKKSRCRLIVIIDQINLQRLKIFKTGAFHGKIL